MAGRPRPASTPAGVPYDHVDETRLYFRGPDGERLELIADPLRWMYGETSRLTLDLPEQDLLGDGRDVDAVLAEDVADAEAAAGQVAVAGEVVDVPLVGP